MSDSFLDEGQESTFSTARQATPQLLFQHAVQSLQVAAVVRSEEVAALCSEHTSEAAALHSTEGFTCCQDTLSPLQYLQMEPHWSVKGCPAAQQHIADVSL